MGDLSYEEVVEYGHTPTGRAVMAVLTERGHYDETPDAFEWAVVDAGNVAGHIERHGWTFRNVWDALADTGLHDPANGASDASCLGDDVRAIHNRLSPLAAPECICEVSLLDTDPRSHPDCPSHNAALDGGPNSDGSGGIE